MPVVNQTAVYVRLVSLHEGLCHLCHSPPCFMFSGCLVSQRRFVLVNSLSLLTRHAYPGNEAEMVFQVFGSDVLLTQLKITWTCLALEIKDNSEYHCF